MQHKQQADLYNVISKRPNDLSDFDLKALDAFLSWSVEAQGYLPKNDAAKIVMDKILAHLAGRMPYIILEIATLDGFLQWIEAARSGGAIPNELARETIDRFVAYRDRLQAYEERKRAATRNYWQH